MQFAIFWSDYHALSFSLTLRNAYRSWNKNIELSLNYIQREGKSAVHIGYYQFSITPLELKDNIFLV